MTPERWRAISEIFNGALEEPPSRVEEFLKEACGNDLELYADVRAMLREHARSGLLDEPIISSGRSSDPVFEGGQLVGERYRIIRFIGQGGMGEVYEAEDLELHEHVALKTLLSGIASDAQMITRFKQELQLSRRIGHPNVCRVFDLARHPANGFTPATYFLTMEFLQGETLAAKLRREHLLPREQAFPLITQMADALDAAHRQGVVHRDFKPSNVMLVRSEAGLRAVVTDFGLARSTVHADDSTATLSGKLMGTLDYMAPELLAGGVASPGSDLYALGLVACKMFTGELPQRGATPRWKAFGLDSRWDRAFSHVLHPDPSRRFRTAEDFVRFLQGAPPVARLNLRLNSRQQAAAALLVVLALIAGLAGWRKRDEGRGRLAPEAVSLYQRGIEDIRAGSYFAATKALGEVVRLAPNFSLAHARLAESWIELDLQEKAQEEMVRAQREDNARLGEIDRLQIAAISLTVTREFDSAVQKYEQIVRLAGSGDGVSIDAARAYMRAGKPDPAIGLFRRVAEGPGNSEAAWLWLGVLYARRADAAKSAQAFDQAERQYQFTSNLEGLIELADQRGIAAYRAGDLEASGAYYRKAFETAHSAGNLQQEIRAELQLSTHSYLSGNAAQAEEYARHALEEAQANELEVLAISGIVNLGNACNQKRDSACAERNYQDALTRARRNGSARMSALTLISLASLHYDQDRFADASHEAHQALDYYQANRFADESFKALTIMGRADYHRGEDARALAAFGHLLELAQKAQNRPEMALAHENIGLVYSRQQRYPEALVEYRKNLELSTDAIHGGYARLQSADVFWMLGLYNDAESMFAQAAPIGAKYPPLQLSLLRARANLALSRNQYGHAMALARLALAGGTASPGTKAELNSIVGLALLGSGQKQAGLRACEEALRTAESLNDDEVLMQTRLALVKAKLESGDRPGALAVFHQAESNLSRFPEWRWRALALMARTDSLYLTPARRALDQLTEQWGSNVIRPYLERPDIKPLARPFLSSFHAEH